MDVFNRVGRNRHLRKFIYNLSNVAHTKVFQISKSLKICHKVFVSFKAFCCTNPFNHNNWASRSRHVNLAGFPTVLKLFIRVIDFINKNHFRIGFEFFTTKVEVILKSKYRGNSSISFIKPSKPSTCH